MRCERVRQKPDGPATDELAELLRGVAAPPVPEDFAACVVAAAERRPAAPPARPWRWWTSAPVPLRLAAAAGLALSLSLGALMGRSLARGTAPASHAAAQADPAAVYGLDALAAAPSGSLAEAYLSLASAPREEGE